MNVPPASAWANPSQPVSAPENEKPDGIKRVRVKLETSAEIAREARTLTANVVPAKFHPILPGSWRSFCKPLPGSRNKQRPRKN